MYKIINHIKKMLRISTKQNTISTDTVVSFKVSKVLQKGKNGTVFLGNIFDGEKNKKIVLKTFAKKDSYLRELKSLLSLNHQNIIKIIGYFGNFENQENLNQLNKIPRHIRIEYAAYGDLYNFMEKVKYINDEKVLRTFTKPIIIGLHYAYNIKSISHRDIKLENIFIMEDGTIKIGDWGLAAIDCKNKLFEDSIGTISYMSPELLCKKKYYSQKVDIWAFAVLLFSLYAGKRPYSEPEKRQQNDEDTSWKDDWLAAMIDNEWNIWWKSHLRNEPHLSKLSPSLKSLFERMFQGDMNKRITLDDVLNDEWMVGEVYSNETISLYCGKHF